ncbi:hypothetical protein [Paraglaciecola sp. L3A3]|uniref:hypothetical protein n=1 Tax=Paraglaciecola sp. L3A3 TaxID=2686358 RepID=UPI00131CCE4A|nr:hypothetical protein [Paraglaciecola sp. L3A3]
MLIRAYLPKFITALFGGLFIALGIYSFGNAQIFDRVFLAILIFTAIVCRENINVVSVIVIITIQLMIDELAWPLINHLPYFKLILYLFSFWAIYYLSHDKLINLILPVLVLASAAEVYWQITDYPAPQITWYIWLMLSNLLLRHLIMIRVGLIDEYFSSKGLSINLDWLMYKMALFTSIVHAAMLIEYLIRHIANMPNILVVYTVFPYILQGISTLYIWVIFHESYKLLLPKLMKV